MLEPAECLRAAVADLGEPLSMTAYQDWRERQDPRPMTAWAIRRRFDGWPAACRAAGIRAAGESYRRWTRDDHLNAVRSAAATVNGPLTPSDYRRWRAAQEDPQPTLDGYGAPEWVELCRQAGVDAVVMGRR